MSVYYKKFDVPIRCKYQDCLMCNPVGKDSINKARAIIRNRQGE